MLPWILIWRNGPTLSWSGSMGSATAGAGTIAPTVMISPTAAAFSIVRLSLWRLRGRPREESRSSSSSRYLPPRLESLELRSLESRSSSDFHVLSSMPTRVAVVVVAVPSPAGLSVSSIATLDPVLESHGAPGRTVHGPDPCRISPVPTRGPTVSVSLTFTAECGRRVVSSLSPWRMHCRDIQPRWGGPSGPS